MISSMSKSKYLFWKNEKGNDMERSDNCKFCKNLSMLKDIQNAAKKKGYSNEIKVGLISFSYLYDQHYGTTVYHDFELKYCPECGKEIK